MKLANNIMSNNVLRNYNIYSKNGSSALEKICTGKKINNSKDNPNKIGKLNELRTKIKSLDSAKKNVQDSISFVQVADATLQEVDNALNRMKELMTAASTDVLSDTDKRSIEIEMESLKEHINDLSTSTKFNGNKVIGNDVVTDNEHPYINKVQIGVTAGDTIDIPTFNFSTFALKDSDGNRLSEIKVGTIEECLDGIKIIDASKEITSKARSRYGALQNVLENSYDRLEDNEITMTKAMSQVGDSDIALEMIELTKSQLLTNTSLLKLKETSEFPREVLNILSNMK